MLLSFKTIVLHYPKDKSQIPQHSFRMFHNLTAYALALPVEFSISFVFCAPAMQKSLAAHHMYYALSNQPIFTYAVLSTINIFSSIAAPPYPIPPANSWPSFRSKLIIISSGKACCSMRVSVISCSLLNPSASPVPSK